MAGLWSGYCILPLLFKRCSRFSNMRPVSGNSLFFSVQAAKCRTTEKQGKTHSRFGFEFMKPNRRTNACFLSRTLKKWRWRKISMSSLSRQTRPQTTSTPRATIMHHFSFRSSTQPLWVRRPVFWKHKLWLSQWWNVSSMFFPTDPTSIAKLQNIFHEYERSIQKVRSRHGYLSDKVNQLDAERAELKNSLEEVKDAKSALERNQLELQTEVTNLKYEWLFLLL